MKKLFYVSLVLAFALCLAGCGDRVYEKYVGEWIAVEGHGKDDDIYNRNMPEFKIHLKDTGKGEVRLGIERKDLKWSVDDSFVTLKIDGDTYRGSIKEEKIVFKDFLQTGFEITFVQKDDVESDFEKYMPDADKKMTGTWVSYKVEDVLGDDLSDTVQADGLFITFKSDYTADLKIEEIERKNEKWSMLDESWGSLDDTDCDLSWDIINDEIKVTYYTGKEFYIFYCKKIQKEI